MANKQTGNTYYIDSTGSVASKNLTLQGIVVTATAAGAILKLKDLTVPGTLIDIRIAADQTTQHLDFSTTALTFPNGLDVESCTNCVATALIRMGGG